MKEIGQYFELSSIKVGRLLVEMGLRNPDKTPTEYAIQNGFVWRVDQSRFTSEPYYLWHDEKTSDAIDSYLEQCAHDEWIENCTHDDQLLWG